MLSLGTDHTALLLTQPGTDIVETGGEIELQQQMKWSRIAHSPALTLVQEVSE